MTALPDLANVRAERCRRTLSAFVKDAWHTVEHQNPLIWNWHLDAVCLHLQAVSAAEIRKLLINMPPGLMKSLLVAVFWPAWVWVHNPTWSAIFGSYDQGLSTRDSIRCRDVIESVWYQETFKLDWRLRGDQNVKTWFANDKGGFRLATSVGGRGTGFRGDCVVFDDPHNIKAHLTDGEIENVRQWWDIRMSTRLNDPKTGTFVGVMQRLHEGDLSGHLRARGGYDLLVLPSEFEPDERSETSIGWKDPRTKLGELLFEKRIDADTLAEARESLGEYGYAGQHQQNPVPRGGGVFKRHCFRFWYDTDEPPDPVRVVVVDPKTNERKVVACAQAPLPDEFELVVNSWDFAFKKTDTSDHVAGETWATKLATFYLLDLVVGHKSFTESVSALIALGKEWPLVSAHLVEDKANGTAVMDILDGKVAGLTPIEPEGGKLVRAHACSPLVEAGDIYLPHPSCRPWVTAFLDEVCGFPKRRYDDAVDAMTQALIWLKLRLPDPIWFD